jgi:hypothetical protein
MFRLHIAQLEMSDILDKLSKKYRVSKSGPKQRLAEEQLLGI